MEQSIPILEHGFSHDPAFKDRTELVKRIAASYRLAAKEFSGHGASMWGAFGPQQASILNPLACGDLATVGKLLADPSQTDFFWGYDDLIKTFVDHRLAHPEEHPANLKRLYDALVQVAIAVGALRCPYTEANQQMPSPEVEELLIGIDRVIGVAVDFPNPFRMAFGLATVRGIVTDRAIQAIYQAWRLKQLSMVLRGTKVLEIGAGLGRNAYYARRLGLTDYTLVDIPSTQIAQGYYLESVCGAGCVSLHGELDNGSIRLLSPGWLAETRESFDIVLNVDSLVEMDPDVARGYVTFARDRAGAFLSVNHEFNPTRVGDLLRQAGMTPISRSPYWPRSGYVEEVVLCRV
jgi:hypothetical protein